MARQGKTTDDMERFPAIMSMVSLNAPPQTLNVKYLKQLTGHVRYEAKTNNAAGSTSIWQMKMDPRHPSLGLYPYLKLLLVSFVALTEIIDQDLALLEVCARGKDDQRTTAAAKALQDHLNLSGTLSPIFKENFDLYQKLFDQFNIDLDGCCGCSCSFLTVCWLPAITGRINTLDYYQSMVRWSLVCCEQYSVYAKAILKLSPTPTSDEVIVLFESKLFKKMGDSKPEMST